MASNRVMLSFPARSSDVLWAGLSCFSPPTLGDMLASTPEGKKELEKREERVELLRWVCWVCRVESWEDREQELMRDEMR